MTNNTPEKISDIYVAADLIKDVAEGLNTKGFACEHCGTMRRHSLVEYRTSSELIHLSKRLIDCAVRIKEGKLKRMEYPKSAHR
jgi:hypothetical protein